jgi:hypothetical protein
VSQGVVVGTDVSSAAVSVSQGVLVAAAVSVSVSVSQGVELGSEVSTSLVAESVAVALSLVEEGAGPLMTLVLAGPVGATL